MSYKILWKSLIAIIVILICYLSLSKWYYQKYIGTDNKSYSVTTNTTNTTNKPSTVNIFLPPQAPYPSCIDNVSEDNPATWTLHFDTPIKVDGISVYFPGNYDSVTSFSPKNLSISYETGNKQAGIFPYISDNKESYLNLFIDKNINLSKISFLSTEANYDGKVCISDLKFYQSSKTNFIGAIAAGFINWQDGIYSYLFFYAISTIILFGPGTLFIYLIASKRKINRDLEFLITLAPVLSLFVLAILGTVYTLSGLKIEYFIYALVIITIVFATIKYKQNYRVIRQSLIPLLIFSLSLLLLFITIGKRDFIYNLNIIGHSLDQQIPIPSEGYAGYFADNYTPWKLARVYNSRQSFNTDENKTLLKGISLTEKLPGYPMILVSWIRSFGESHFGYQRFTEVIKAAFYLAVYCLIKKFYNKKIALISTLLLLLNVQYTLTAFTVELFYKYIAILPLLASLLLFRCYRNSKYTPISVALLNGFGFIIHPVTFFPSLSLLLVYIIIFKNRKMLMKFSAPLIMTLIVVWIAYLFVPRLYLVPQLKSGQRTDNIYIGIVFKNNNNLLKTKIDNLKIMIFPPREKTSPYRTVLLKYSIVGILSPAIFIALILSIIKFIRNGHESTKTLMILGIAPLLIYWLIYLNKPIPATSPYFQLYPFAIPIIFAVSVHFVQSLHRIWRIVFYSSYCVWMAYCLVHISGLITNLRYSSFIVNQLSTATLITFGAVSILVLYISAIADKHVKKHTDEKG